jgi:hypothetical protein
MKLLSGGVSSLMRLKHSYDSVVGPTGRYADCAAKSSALFFRRRHQPRRPPGPERPAPAKGPGTNNQRYSVFLFAKSVTVITGSG